MKRAIIGLLCMYAASAFAGTGMPCEKLEYARLKDSSKSELTSEYCSSMSKADFNSRLKDISKELFEKRLALGVDTAAAQRDMQERGENQVSCLRAAEDAASMLKKKFKTVSPKCPASAQ
jgi:hypothetical protein